MEAEFILHEVFVLIFFCGKGIHDESSVYRLMLINTRSVSELHIRMIKKV